MEFPIASLGAAIIGTLAILAWRVRESRRPGSLRSLIIPPLGMSTGFSMFAVPAFRIPWTWGLAAFVLGALVRLPACLVATAHHRGRPHHDAG